MPLILFVCTGNTCRSVIAEALLRRYLDLHGGASNLAVASAGLAANPGDPASAHVRTLLREEGIDAASHTATRLDAGLVEQADLILVMTTDHLAVLLSLFPEATSKAYLLKEYAGIACSNPNIADPFGGPLDKYRQTLEEIRASILKSMVKLRGGVGDAGGPG